MPTPSTSAESERRQATVLFADISGFTAMSEKLDPENLTSIMNECFELLGSIVEAHEGTIDKFIGDAIMAVFGVPIAIEEAPKKAVNTAIEMRNRLYQFNQEKKVKPPLDIHIGINTGMVIAGEIGSDEKRDYSVMGDTVNLASRLEDASGRGQIYIGPQTYRYTKNDFEFKQLEPITLKGKVKPVPIYELLSRKEKLHRARLGAERMIFSKMVGRDKELDRLELHVHKAINGEGSIVNVIGEAGIGKSRLIAELQNREVMKKVTYLEGRAISTGKNLSFYPIIDIVKHWARISEEDSALESIHKLEVTVNRIDPTATSEIVPFIATLMGVRLTGRYAERVSGIEGEALEKLILKNIRDLIAKAAGYSTIVYVLEDLHWADQSSLELLESLYRLVENRSILFINVFRPGYKETSGKLLEAIIERYPGFQSEIRLTPLDDSQCEILINNLLKTKGLPASVRELITKRAEGNPFFIEEVGRSFIDDDVVLVKDGAFEITDKINSVVIPETIQDVLMTRIDRLDEETKSLVKVASVIGRNFFYKILAEVAKRIEEIDQRLDYLKDTQLILERERLEELEYIFKHALVQETTYESILLQKRKELHLNTAKAIESVFSERLHDFYGMLALHYSRGEDLEKAEEYLIKAGEEALKAAASSEALSYFQEALKLYVSKYGDAGDPEKIASLKKNIAIAHFNKGHMFEAVEYFDLVLEFLGGRSPKSGFMRIARLIVNLLSVLAILYIPILRVKKIPEKKDNEMVGFTYNRGRAFSTIDATRFFIDSIIVLRMLNRLDVAKVENGAAIYCATSALFFFTGMSFKIGKKIQDYAREHINKDDIKSAFAFNFYKIAFNYFAGNWEKERNYDEDGIAFNLKIGELWHTVTYMIYCSHLQTKRGNFKDSENWLNQIHEIAEIYDNDYAVLSEYIGRPELLLHRRSLSHALHEAEEGISYLVRTGQDLIALKILGMKANIQILMKDFEDAKSTLEQARKITFQEKQIMPHYLNDFLISQFLFDLRMLEEALNANNKLKLVQLGKIAYKSGKAAIKNAMKDAEDKTKALELMGLYQWLRGKQRKALVWWDKSIETGKRLGALPELSRTYMEIGKRLLGSESKQKELNGIKAEEYLMKARTMFEEMDLQWDLNELDKLEYTLGNA